MSLSVVISAYTHVKILFCKPHLITNEYASALQVHLLWTSHFCEVNFLGFNLKNHQTIQMGLSYTFSHQCKPEKSPHELSPNWNNIMTLSYYNMMILWHNITTNRKTKNHEVTASS